MRHLLVHARDAGRGRPAAPPRIRVDGDHLVVGKTEQVGRQVPDRPQSGDGDQIAGPGGGRHQRGHRDPHQPRQHRGHRVDAGRHRNGQVRDILLRGAAGPLAEQAVAERDPGHLRAHCLDLEHGRVPGMRRKRVRHGAAQHRQHGTGTVDRGQGAPTHLAAPQRQVVVATQFHAVPRRHQDFQVTHCCCSFRIHGASPSPHARPGTRTRTR